MNRLYLAASIALSIALWAHAAIAREIPDIQRDISAKKAAISAQTEKRSADRANLAALEAQVPAAEQVARDRQHAKDSAEQRLRNVSEFKVEHPEVSDAKERADYDAGKKDLQAALQNVSSLNTRLSQVRADVAQQEAISAGMQNDLAALNDELEAARYERLRQQIEQDRTVEAEAEVSCGENMSIKDCRQLALDTAKRRAVEKGSAMLVDSATEVENFQLTKDQIRSSVRGIIKSVEEQDKHIVGEGSGYYYKIRAVVHGQVPEALKPKPNASRTPLAQGMPISQNPSTYVNSGINPVEQNRNLPSNKSADFQETMRGNSIDVFGFPGIISSATGSSDCHSCSFLHGGGEVIFGNKLGIALSGTTGKANLVNTSSSSNGMVNITYSGRSTDLEAVYYFGDTLAAGFGGLLTISSNGTGTETLVATGETHQLSNFHALGLVYSGLFHVSDSVLLGIRVLYMEITPIAPDGFHADTIYAFDLGASIGYSF